MIFFQKENKTMKGKKKTRQKTSKNMTIFKVEKLTAKSEKQPVYLINMPASLSVKVENQKFS